MNFNGTDAFFAGVTTVAAALTWCALSLLLTKLAKRYAKGLRTKLCVVLIVVETVFVWRAAGLGQYLYPDDFVLVALVMIIGFALPIVYSLSMLWLEDMLTACENILIQRKNRQH